MDRRSCHERTVVTTIVTGSSQVKLVTRERPCRDLGGNTGEQTIVPRANCSYNDCDRLFTVEVGDPGKTMQGPRGKHRWTDARATSKL